MVRRALWRRGVVGLLGNEGGWVSGSHVVLEPLAAHKGMSTKRVRVYSKARVDTVRVEDIR